MSQVKRCPFRRVPKTVEFGDCYADDCIAYMKDEDGKEHCSIIENPQDVINPDKVTNILGFSND